MDVGADAGDVAGTAGQVDQPAIAHDQLHIGAHNLPLAGLRVLRLLVEGDQVGQPAHVIGFQPQRGALHQCPKERHRFAFLQLRGGADGVRNGPHHPFRIHVPGGDCGQLVARLIVPEKVLDVLHLTERLLFDFGDCVAHAATFRSLRVAPGTSRPARISASASDCRISITRGFSAKCMNTCRMLVISA